MFLKKGFWVSPQKETDFLLLFILKIFFKKKKKKRKQRKGLSFWKLLGRTKYILKRFFVENDFIFKEKGWEKIFKNHFLRIECRGHVLPKHIYFTTHY